jgi:hypothetical protein
VGESQDPIRQASTSSWARRLPDGRCLVMSIVDWCPMPAGVNDAVIQTDLHFGRMRDETENAKGCSNTVIMKSGWKPIHGGVSFSKALQMVDR